MKPGVKLSALFNLRHINKKESEAARKRKFSKERSAQK